MNSEAEELDNWKREYRWDVAISLLAEEEPLARELKDSLERAGYKVFVYSDEQPELAGQDGDSKFSEVFREEARVCVVLYRPKWGRTRWTAVEERAIRDRINSGQERPEEFLWIINLDEAPPDLKWLPNWIIYRDFSTFGIEGAAASVAVIARKAGATPKPETAESMAKRLARFREWKREGQAFLRSPEGKAVLEREVEAVFSGLELIVSRIASQRRLALRCERRTGFIKGVEVCGERLTLLVGWEPAYFELENVSAFQVRLLDGYQRSERVQSREDPRELLDLTFGIRLTASMEIRWVEEGHPTHLYASHELADYLLKALLDHIEP